LAFVKDKIFWKAVRDVVKMERQNGIQKWGDFASSMERYAIMKAEVEEAEDEMKNLFEELENYWQSVKNNKNDFMKGDLAKIDEKCTYLISEILQVMGCCYDKE